LAPAVHVLTACNEYRQETLILERSAAAHGYSFQALGLGAPWRGVGTKLTTYNEALRKLLDDDGMHPEEPVVLLDAWDTVLLGPAEEFREKLKEAGALKPDGLVICAADRICAPDYKLAPRVERLFPDVTLPWRYPNSGMFAGAAGAMRLFLHNLVHGTVGGPFSEDGDDQLRVQEVLLACAELDYDVPVRLDSECRFVQCMGEPALGWDLDPVSRRITNRTTCERPLIAHGCGGHGRWFLADIYRDLRLLEHLHVSDADLAKFEFAGLVAPGEQVTPEHWVDQPPWDYPFQLFEVIRAMELAKSQVAQ